MGMHTHPRVERHPKEKEKEKERNRDEVGLRCVPSLKHGIVVGQRDGNVCEDTELHHQKKQHTKWMVSVTSLLEHIEISIPPIHTNSNSYANIPALQVWSWLVKHLYHYHPPPPPFFPQDSSNNLRDTRVFWNNYHGNWNCCNYSGLKIRNENIRCIQTH